MKNRLVLAFTAVVLVTGWGSVAYSDELLLMLPSIFAKKKEPPPITYGVLNDTGITFGGAYPSGNNTDCTGEEIFAQDCSHGRDATHNDDSDGHAGFSYTKLNSSGQPLADQAAVYATTPWACVQDNVTGLIWEVKTDDGGLHDKDDRYTWYNTNAATNGGAAGVDGAANNTCSGWSSGDAATYCNTQAYMNRVNAVGLCGANDWRMPTVKELESLVNFYSSPVIDTGYFPNTMSNWYWSGSPSAFLSNSAWNVYFTFGGYSDFDNRGYNVAVRLVRGGQ
jgi:hypothetical protein